MNSIRQGTIDDMTLRLSTPKLIVSPDLPPDPVLAQPACRSPSPTNLRRHLNHGNQPPMPSAAPPRASPAPNSNAIRVDAEVVRGSG